MFIGLAMFLLAIGMVYNGVKFGSEDQTDWAKTQIHVGEVIGLFALPLLSVGLPIFSKSFGESISIRAYIIRYWNAFLAIGFVCLVLNLWYLIHAHMWATAALIAGLCSPAIILVLLQLKKKL